MHLTCTSYWGCGVQRILAEFHAQRMRVLTTQPPAVARQAPPAQTHHDGDAWPVGICRPESMTEGIDAEDVGAEFAGGVRFVLP
jgi:hypothetical protein